MGLGRMVGTQINNHMCLFSRGSSNTDHQRNRMGNSNLFLGLETCWRLTEQRRKIGKRLAAKARRWSSRIPLKLWKIEQWFPTMMMKIEGPDFFYLFAVFMNSSEKFFVGTAEGCEVENFEKFEVDRGDTHARHHTTLELQISGEATNEVCKKLASKEWFRVEAEGFSGGIWILWRKESVDLNIIYSHTQFEHLCINMKLGRTWCLLVVYASTYRSK